MDPVELCHNCRIKRYPGGRVDILAASRAFGGGEVVRFPDHLHDTTSDDREMEAVQRLAAVNPRLAEVRRIRLEEGRYERLERFAIQEDGGPDPAQERRQRSRERSQRRARAAVRDLGLCNPWRFFVTLTLDGSRINRYDPVEVLRHLRYWLDNQVRRRGLAYVLVPEHHKDGAIHFHGFFNGALPAVDSGHKDKGGHTVYNLPSWGWGFSTAIELYGERAAAVNYCCKYISKEQSKIGGRWYYSGGALERPAVEWTDVDFSQWSQGKEIFFIPGLSGVGFARVVENREPCGPVVCPKADAEGIEPSRDLKSVHSGVNHEGPSRCMPKAPRPSSALPGPGLQFLDCLSAPPSPPPRGAPALLGRK